MEWAEATKLYSAILEEDPCHQVETVPPVSLLTISGIEMVRAYL